MFRASVLKEGEVRDGTRHKQAEELADEVLAWAFKSVKPHPRYKAPCVDGAQYLALVRKLERFLGRPTKEKPMTEAKRGSAVEQDEFNKWANEYGVPDSQREYCKAAYTYALSVQPRWIEALREHPVGSWLSAALEDPKVCKEMKGDIEDWFEVLAHGPNPEKGA